MGIWICLQSQTHAPSLVAFWQPDIVPTWCWYLFRFLLCLCQVTPEDHLLPVQSKGGGSRFIAADAECSLDIVCSWRWGVMFGCEEDLLAVPHPSGFGFDGGGEVIFHFCLADLGRGYSRLILRNLVPLPKDRTALEVELLRLCEMQFYCSPPINKFQQIQGAYKQQQKMQREAEVSQQYFLKEYSRIQQQKCKWGKVE